LRRVSRPCRAALGSPCSCTLKTVSYLRDAFVDPEHARVSILEPGYLVGDGVFATMRAYEGVCFRAARHVASLERAAAAFGLELPPAFEQAIAIADEAAQRTLAEDAYVRVTLARGAAPTTTVLSVIARPMVLPSDHDYARGVTTVTVTPRRIPPECLSPSIKSTSYAPQLLARREAERQGATEGLQLALDGSLACGAMSNLFVMIGDALLTPPLETGCRAGVTREALLDLAPKLFREVREERLPPSIFGSCDEAFLTSTRIECLPIARVDDVVIGTSFARTHALRSAFRELVRREVSR
jgi:branched-subunit amino acid aminotransferase/4-amino-4-deoxychorismate lyase